MYRQTFIIAILIIVTSFMMSAQENDNWKIFQLDEVDFKTDAAFIDMPTIEASLAATYDNYALPVSIFDRVVFVNDGFGAVILDQEQVPLAKGDVLFVKAKDTLTFIGELHLLLWSAKAKKSNHNFQTQHFSEKILTEHRNASTNVWHRFIENTSMTTGLYMLPKGLNGDDTLVHTMDEINFVVKGRAKFKMNDTIIDVKPGSVMWVKRGVGHYFYDLSEDFDVFILFEHTQ